jgi:hypothetical protein
MQQRSPSLPTKKIQKNVTQCKAREVHCHEKEITDSFKKFVLIASGTYSPIHLLHLGMLECAKSYLESKGKVVVAGYLIPGCV